MNADNLTFKKVLNLEINWELKEAPLQLLSEHGEELSNTPQPLHILCTIALFMELLPPKTR